MIWPRGELLSEKAEPAPERIPTLSPQVGTWVTDLVDPVDTDQEPWLAVLDDLEARLVMTGPQSPDWVVPVNLGPLPAALRERAHGVAVGQDAALKDLQFALEATAAELATLKPVHRGAPAIYLDVMG